eukprot:355846-Chlamydomonas_euryale.AAC.10
MMRASRLPGAKSSSSQECVKGCFSTCAPPSSDEEEDPDAPTRVSSATRTRCNWPRRGTMRCGVGVDGGAARCPREGAGVARARPR